MRSLSLLSVFLTPVVIASLALPSIAQGPIVSQDTLVGWTPPISPATSGNLDLQALQKCPPAKRVCKNILFKPSFFWSGGTAYDPRHQSVWASDGALLVEYKVRGCKAICKQKPALVLTSPVAKSTVTGLAISDRHSRLFHLEMIPGRLAIVTYDNKKCPPKAISRCILSMGKRDIAAGLAYDETRDLIYFTISQFQSTSGTYQTVLFQAPASKPCSPVCKWVIPSKCSKKPVTGLAYNACADMVYATDGAVTSHIRVQDPKKCKFSLVACCKKQLAGDWKGLAMIPGWSLKRVGKSCIGKPCPNCTSMVHHLAGGDTSLGNPDFKLMLSNAPANQIGILYIKLGAAGAGIQPNFLCAPFYAFPPALFVVTGLPGVAPCGGKGQVSLPLPNSKKLCGLKLTTQWLVLCKKGNNFGLSLSNALEFSLASS